MKLMLKMSVADLEEFFATHFPGMNNFHFRIESLELRHVQMRLLYHDLHLRPGGTVSGPTMMTLADTVGYILVLATIGPVALAVTSSLNINFLRKPAPVDLIARGTLLKLGSRLAVCQVDMFSDGRDELVAHSTVTYSIPT
jgi:uncharacterized protein (TIGR00369 family)